MTWHLRNLKRLALMLACVLGLAGPLHAESGTSSDESSGSGSAEFQKLDAELAKRARQPQGDVRVIVELAGPTDSSDMVVEVNGRMGRRLRSFNGRVVVVSEKELEKLARHPLVKRLHLDRPTRGLLNRTAVTVGARYVQYWMGYDGTGVGVAVIDSGITAWHDDLRNSSGGQRVAAFKDFVHHLPSTYDDNGHGTHVAGVIAGNGYDTYGVRAGIAPGVHLIGLKVLDANGAGYISDVIAAFDYAIAHKSLHNIRVINLSVGAAVTSSYEHDPLTLAAKQAVDAGIVVVVAAGNLGKNAAGEIQYGAITAPGNAPWVLTVGASNHEGTVLRYDDTIARYSSRGPTAIDYLAKPDLVAPGTGTVSLSDPTSTFYVTKNPYLMSGTRLTAYKPYLSLSGTSMAAPVVAGTVALMLEANPTLTPNAVKAILQYTAEKRAGLDALTQGAGFLNSQGAVELAKFFRNPQAGQRYPTRSNWSKQIIWGNQRVTGGILSPDANAWTLNVVWGTLAGGLGENIVWGTLCGGGDCENIVWGTLDAENVVWGTNIVWGTVDALNVVWGTLAEAENIVWGTDCGGGDCENIVWGTAGVGENVVWGTADLMENIVWGTNVVWGTVDALNVVWGTSGLCENVVWGTSSDATWGNSGETMPIFDDPEAPPAEFDSSVWDDLFEPSDPPPPPPPGPDPGEVLPTGGVL
ncbi:MAG: S8 family peptidase [Vicinamibacterales bacterium]